MKSLLVQDSTPQTHLLLLSAEEKPRRAAGQAPEIYPENLAGLFPILLGQKQVLMDQSPFPVPHPPAITTLP